MQSPLQTAIDCLLQITGKQWLTGSHTENVDKYADFLLLGGQDKDIKLASDDLNPILFDNKKIVDNLQQCLNWGARIQMIVHRGNNTEEAVISINRTNPKLYHLWIQKSNVFTIYWSPIFLRQPFLVITNVGVLFEIPETAENKRPWHAFSLKNERIAKEWTERFNKYLIEGRLKAMSSL